ncbi:protein of unknown function [Burkholderia multivorans]
MDVDRHRSRRRRADRSADQSQVTREAHRTAPRAVVARPGGTEADWHKHAGRLCLSRFSHQQAHHT